MGAHDLWMKKLASRKEFAADAVNSLCCDGEEVVKPGDVLRVSEQTTYIKAGNIAGQNRDVFYRILVSDGKTFDLFFVGFENQTTIDRRMPVRVMGYNHGDYRDFLDNHPNEPLPPIITFVLYFGQDPWTGPTSLLGMMTEEDRERYKKWVSDYKIHVIDLGRLTYEEILKFRGVFKTLATLCTRMCGKEYPIHHDPSNNFPELVPVMESMGGEVTEDMLASIRKGEEFMTVFEAFYAKDFQRAELRGEQMGELKVVAKMLSKGKTPEEIFELTDIPLEQIRSVQAGALDA